MDDESLKKVLGQVKISQCEGGFTQFIDERSGVMKIAFVKKLFPSLINFFIVATGNTAWSEASA